MNRFRNLFFALLLILPVFSASAAEQTMAPLCASCHQADSNMARGTLDYFVDKDTVKTFQLDMSAPGKPAKMVFRFNNNTVVKNMEDLEEMGDHKGKAFRVYYYVNKAGENVAALITRFDILNSITPDQKLDKAALKNIILHDKNTVVIDARPPMKYKEGFIPGSIVIPAAEIEKMADKLPKDKNTPLVFYCVGGCSSPTAAMKARGMGYTNVKIYPGGFPDWIGSEISFIAPDLLADSLKKSELSYLVIDTNDKKAVESGHLPNAVNVTAAAFETMKAKLPAKKMVPIAVYGKEASEVASKLIALGYKGTRVVPITMEDWTKAGYPVVKGAAKDKFEFMAMPKPGTISKDDFEKLVKAMPADTMIIDVRTKSEFDAGAFPGAKNIAIENLKESLSQLPKDKTIVTVCASGVRAEMAFNLLKEAGYKVKYLDSLNKFQNGGYEIIPN